MKILLIPDVQVRPGDDFTFLERIGHYIVDKQPDVIVQIGDFADMASLSSYDVGKKSFEGKRYTKDIEAAHEAMKALLKPLALYNNTLAKKHKTQYKPRMVLTLGNHEERINKAVENDAKLEGVLDIEDLWYEEFGWEVIPFLQVVVVGGIAFSHYFVSGLLGRPVPSVATLLTKKHMSCIMGHQQGLQVTTGYRGDGKPLTCIIAGSCYEHDEDYLSPQSNQHWRGVVMLHDVDEGSFDPMFVSLKFLKEKYS